MVKLYVTPSGCFVLVDTIKEGGKLKGEIIHLLLKEQIQHLMDEGVWPDSKRFSVPSLKKPKDKFRF
ncbi:hypothetical protein TNIN_487101 [Trichonephila inaurata madagascariensis]|uniref:Uncharacterized protein n=1 Tax=Trichonephila inaurata madagascariensis TaxID=2747483 RepID=A0A8X6J9E0_9ARAC|nr:hypothetical protein TNIN_487101 [Trichonephila inaurata madagascariensis]